MITFSLDLTTDCSVCLVVWGDLSFALPYALLTPVLFNLESKFGPAQISSENQSLIYSVNIGV